MTGGHRESVWTLLIASIHKVLARGPMCVCAGCDQRGLTVNVLGGFLMWILVERVLTLVKEDVYTELQNLKGEKSGGWILPTQKLVSSLQSTTHLTIFV